MQSVTSCTSYVSSRTQSVFRRLFNCLGVNIYLHYRLFLLFGVLLTLITATCGILYYSFLCNDGHCIENRIDYLWIPRSSEVWSHYTEIIDLFGSYPSSMTLLLRTVDPDDSIIIPSNLDISFNIFESINNISTNYKNNEYLYEDLCFRSHPLSPVCDSTFGNFFGFFFNENDLLWSNESLIDEIVNTPNAPTAFFLGGFEYDESVIVGAQAMRFMYELIGSTNETVQDIVYEYMEEWLNYWSEHASDYEEIKVDYWASRSFDDEVARVISGDIPIFVLALFVMLFYLMFTLGKISCISARPWLAFSAIIVMMCALLMGFSIGICLDTTFNTIVILVPFILLGVGVDDMIILMDCYDCTPMPEDDILNAHLRLGNALASSGLSISLTSFCSSMAFFVGSATDIPGISSFCIYAAWCFLTNYLLQFLLFVPLMVIDDKRERNKKNFCCPCLCVHDKKLTDKSQVNFFDPEKVVKNNGALSSTKYKKDSMNISKCNAQYLMKLTLIPCLKRRWCRILIILAFISTVVLSIYVSSFIETDSDATKLIPDDSYILPFMEEVNDIYGGNMVGELQIVLKNIDFSDIEARNSVMNMMIDMESQDDALGETTNWLIEFEEWLTDKDIDIDELESDAFYVQLQIFSNASSTWHSEIKYDDIVEPREVMATRFELKMIKAGSVIDQYPEYISWNVILKQHLGENTGSYAFITDYSFAFLSFEIVGLTIKNMIFAGCGVGSILLLFLDLRMAVFIMIIVAMIDIHLFGWIYLIDITLDSLTYTQCVMAVGLTVDYVIHIVHAIADAPFDEFDDKITFALSSMGASVCKGAFTTFLGGIALLLSESQAFRIFFFMFSGIISIAVTHGMILTPALLGELRFIYMGIEKANENTKAQYESKTDKIVTNLKVHHAIGNSNISRSDFDNEYTSSNVNKRSSRSVITGKRSSVMDANSMKLSLPQMPENKVQMTNSNHQKSHSKDSDSSFMEQFED